MIDSPDPRPAWLAGQPEIRSRPVTCSVCGCRLQPLIDQPTEAWTHFGSIAGRDARGCRVDCVGLAHDAAGRALVGVAV